MNVHRSQYLRLIPDHTGLLKEGEAFVTGVNEMHLKTESKFIVVMQRNICFPSNLIKLQLPSSMTLRHRSFASCENSNETDREKPDPYSFFEQINDKCLIVSTLGVKSVAFLLSGGTFYGESVLVCWEKKIVDAINEKNSMTSPKCDAIKEEVKDLSKVSQLDRFNDALKFRKFTKDINDLNSMLDKALDFFGFDDDVSQTIAEFLVLTVSG